MVNLPVTAKNDHQPSTDDESVDDTKITTSSPSPHSTGGTDSAYNKSSSAAVEDDHVGLRPTDILLGRGSGANQSEGNTQFRNTVWDTFKEYLLEHRKKEATTGGGENTTIEDTDEALFRPLDAATKNQLARRILHKIHANNGRFLRRLSRLEAQRVVLGEAIAGEANSMYVEITSKKAVEKIKQSLRFQIDQRDRLRSGPNQKKRTDEDRKNGIEVPPTKKARTQMTKHASAGTSEAWRRDANDLLLPPHQPSPLGASLLSGLTHTPGAFDYAIISALQGRPSVASTLLSPAAAGRHHLLSQLLPLPPGDVLAAASASTSRQQREQEQRLASLLVSAGVRSPGPYAGSVGNGLSSYKLDALTDLILRERSELASINAASTELASRIHQKRLERLLLDAAAAQDGLGTTRGLEPLFRQTTPASTLAAASSSSLLADRLNPALLFGGSVLGSGITAADPLIPTVGYNPNYSLLHETQLRKGL